MTVKSRNIKKSYRKTTQRMVFDYLVFTKISKICLSILENYSYFMFNRPRETTRNGTSKNYRKTNCARELEELNLCKISRTLR